MDALEMAYKYYPNLWDKNRIEALVTKNLISREDADKLYMERDPVEE